MSQPQNEVPITIDKQHYKTPNPTTGAALHVLGSVPSGYDLWLTNPGPGDDTLVKNDSTPIDVKQGSHFYTAKSTLNPGAE